MRESKRDQIRQFGTGIFAKFDNFNRYHDGFYTKMAIFLFQINLSLNFIVLEKGKCVDDGKHSNRSVLKYRNVFKKNKLSGKISFRDTLKTISVQLFIIIFLLIDLIFICWSAVHMVSHYSRDKLLYKWSPRMDLHVLKGNGTENDCRLKEENFLRQEDYSRWNELNKVNAALDRINDLYPSIHGLPLTPDIVMPTAHIIFFYLTLGFTWIREMRVEWLAFLIDPENFNLRIRLKINAIIEQLLRKLNVCDEKDAWMDTIANVYCAKHKRSGTETVFFKLLCYIKKTDLVKPLNLSILWCNLSITLFVVLLCFNCIFAIALGLGLCIDWAYSEIEARIEQRFNKFQCLQLIRDYSRTTEENFLPHGNFQFLAPQEQSLLFNQKPNYGFGNNYEDILYRLYHDYWLDMSQVNYNRVFRQEFINYLDYNHLIQLVGLILGTLLCSFWISFYSGLNLFSHVDRILLLEQINDNMRDSVISCYNWNSKNPGKNVVDGISKDNIELYEKLTISYILFELFRREQREFKILVNFLTFQGLLFCSTTMISIYLIGTSVRCDSQYVLLVIVTSVVLYINPYLICAAVLSNKVESIRLNLMRLLAQSKLDSRNYYPSNIFYLWRRHLISIPESRKLYSTSILGIHLSYDRLLTMNVYLIFLWILLLKK